MFPAHISAKNPNDHSRCEERRQAADPEKSLSPIRQTEATLKEAIYHAIWKDDVLRAIEYDEIDVHVQKGIVHLNGHVVSGTSQIRIMNAIQGVPGISRIQNHLVLDDQLTLEVANSLGNLEHTYDCKFFTGASHGAISLDGIVGDKTVKLLAEKQAAGNPKVRGVINHVRVKGSEPGVQGQSFLQPAIGETIYFLDGISGIVRQVIVNPNNRLVISMTVQGHFADQRYEFNSLTDGKARPAEQLVIIPMSVVRYLTRVSGFLYINSTERNRYLDFDSASFSSPGPDWVPPYPYCPDDVLLPVEQPDMKNHIFLEQAPQTSFTVVPKEQLRREYLSNDSLGG